MCADPSVTVPDVLRVRVVCVLCRCAVLGATSSTPCSARAICARSAVVAPSALRAEMETAGLNPLELARIADVPREEVDGWLGGRAPVPAWAV